MKTRNRTRLTDLTPRTSDRVRGGALTLSRSSLQVRETTRMTTSHKKPLEYLVISTNRT